MDDPEFTLLGDAVWLDFVNSALGRTPDPPDLLPDADAFVRWAITLRLLQADRGPPYAAVRELRDHLTALAEAMSVDGQPPAGAIASINQLQAGCTGSHRLVRASGQWHLQFAPSRPRSPLEVIARSAAETLADRSVVVRRCAGEGCSLFFLDSSPTRSRRWCSPAACGASHRVERRRSQLR
jgi:predicted RNA-binding Zn ribbon-like protein